MRSPVFQSVRKIANAAERDCFSSKTYLRFREDLPAIRTFTFLLSWRIMFSAISLAITKEKDAEKDYGNIKKYCQNC